MGKGQEAVQMILTPFRCNNKRCKCLIPIPLWLDSRPMPGSLPAINTQLCAHIGFPYYLHAQVIT